MATICEDESVLTLINVFTVDPDDQDELVDCLVSATEAMMADKPGFVSANLHASLDGERVVNYAQWQSRADFEAIFEDPDVQSHMAEIEAIATADYHLYEVSHVEAAD